MRASAGLRRDWLRSPAFDLTFLLGVLALALAACLSSYLVPALFIPLLTAHVWLFSYDHLIATYTRLVAVPADRWRRLAIYGAPPLLFLAILAVAQGAGAVALNSGYFFLQVHHVTRQSWGVAQRYRRAAGGLPWDDPRLAELTLWAVPVWAVLRRCQEQHSELLSLPLWTPAAPRWLVVTTGALAALLCLRFLVLRLAALRRGELPVGHTLFTVSHLAVFALGYGLLDDIDSGWLLINVWHNVQYLLFVWHENRRRFAAGPSPDAPRLSALCQPGPLRAVGYFLTVLVISIVGCGALIQAAYRASDALTAHGSRLPSLAMVLSLTMNLHHYLLDAIIWRRPRTLQAPLAVA